MDDLPDLYYVNSEIANGNSIVQIYRPDMVGSNRKLSSEELRELLGALKDGTILETAEKFGLRYFSVDYNRQGNGFKAQVRL